MEFVETETFTKRIVRLGLEDELRELQNEILQNPEKGRLDPGTGGLRKIRMADPGRGKGKSGGARCHYLYLSHRKRVYLIFVYGKDEDDTLTPDQKKQLLAVVQRIKQEK